MMPRGSSTLQRGLPTQSNAPLDLQQRLLLDQLIRAQTANSALGNRAVEDLLYQYSSQNLQLPSNIMAYHNDRSVGSLGIGRSHNPNVARAVGGGGAGTSNAGNEAESLLGSGNPDIFATTLAQQILNNYSSNINMTSLADRAAPPANSALRLGLSDATRQLLQVMQNRQRNTSDEQNLAQAEALLQQQLQQKPPAR
jgi:hypothetical protein